MTDEEFRSIWVGASTEVADLLYPKGHPERGNFLRDQAVLYVEMVKQLEARSVLKNSQSEIV